MPSNHDRPMIIFLSTFHLDQITMVMQHFLPLSQMPLTCEYNKSLATKTVGGVVSSTPCTSGVPGRSLDLARRYSSTDSYCSVVKLLPSCILLCPSNRLLALAHARIPTGGWAEGREVDGEDVRAELVAPS